MLPTAYPQKNQKKKIQGIKYILMDLNKEKKLKKNSLNYDFVINASGYGLDQSLEKKNPYYHINTFK